MQFSTTCKGEQPFVPPKCGVFFELVQTPVVEVHHFCRSSPVLPKPYHTLQKQLPPNHPFEMIKAAATKRFCKFKKLLEEG